MTHLAAVLAKFPWIVHTIVAQLPPRGGSGGGGAVTVTRNYTTEWIVVGVVMAAMLAAVCRPSRRQ